ncbi:MAG: Phenylalanine-tRNA ligase beta subunit [Parcubacteria group bacterium GW2011_GWE2_39_37]|uniref:Phenylalanine--tRNA ligase beta subunit n=1 Tax=Candidatus Falkowbacteria bacterium GW2011_GWF2_39_8 TaxID=1618642 RepID=A0A0G0SF46_9BACT|nr:MAG: Phenylalanine-tRNA ligase beta subunit [Parcubacteria group bacterium GW2011_GWE2_39_37]KKR33340.1 MAG: Phenylalanine-tRNA ligase beta subunit [Candidatus Falkowbacteria bacterium GW2011_GWF2_39_8]
MYLSLNWLKDFVKIPNNISSEELAARLTLHTVEVENITDQAKKFDKVIIGKILEISRHPNADRLQLTKVDVGGKEVLNIVCGASNIEVGQLVPVAMIGAVLPNGLEIKEAEVRGEKSQGMLCAADELGLGDDHSGILILEANAKIGQSFAKHLHLDDTIFEVDNKSLTNRPDLWSHMGMAREISAILSTKFTAYKPSEKKHKKITGGIKLNVKVEAGDLCNRYMAAAIEGIKVESSPNWMQQKLIAAGVRPINNIVDITNYVMLELGQPMHAFDQKLVDKIIIRAAKKGEVLETLDGNKRNLAEEMLVIADSKKPLAVAGVMGGANSEISDETTSIVFESANFDFVSTRKTSQKLNLRTESSMRFEKGIDPLLAETALARAIELTLEICPKASIVSEIIDIFPGKKKFLSKQIQLRLDWLQKIIGEDLGKGRVIEILTNLGFEIKEKNDELIVSVPSWRATRDISIAEDLAEEVARIHGFNNIRSLMPKVEMLPPEKNEERTLERRIKELLSKGGNLHEVYNYSFVGEDQLKKLFIDSSSYLKLANPIASHQTMMRQTLVPNLLENVKNNQARFKEFGLFEVGSVFLSIDSEIKKDNQSNDNLPYQEKRIGIVLASDNKEGLFRKGKGIVELLMSSLNLEVGWKIDEFSFNWADKAEVADISVADKIIGSVAKVDNKIAKNIGLKKETVVIELSLRQLLALYKKQNVKLFEEFEKFPPLVRDLAFVINENVLYSDIRAEIINFNQLIKKVELFDVFHGGKLGENKKSLAFHVVYQADRTLTTAEVDQIQAELLKRLEERFEAKIRNF